MKRFAIPAAAVAFGLASTSGIMAQGLQSDQQQGTGSTQQQEQRTYGSGQQGTTDQQGTMGQRGTTGQQQETAGSQEDRIRSMLEAYGYSNIRDMEAAGDTVEATAEREGSQVEVTVDLNTGRVTESEG